MDFVRVCVGFVSWLCACGVLGEDPLCLNVLFCG